ncbi:MAG: hypothetical protein ACJ0OB_03630 [Flavobacteriaceae bacterium]
MRLILFLIIFLSFSKFYSQENSYNIIANFDPNNRKIYIDQYLEFYNKSKKSIEYLILNDWANSYSTSNSKLGKRLSDEYILSFQRSTKNQRGYTLIDKIVHNNNNLDYRRLENNLDLIKIFLKKPLESNSSIKINIKYEIIIPIDDFTGYGINKSDDINIRDWYLTFAKIKSGKWQLESNLDLNDLSHDPAFFDFNISYPYEYQLISDINDLTYKNNDKRKIIRSKRELRKNSYIILTKKSNFNLYDLGKIKIYSDIKNEVDKSDSLINKAIIYIDKKTGNYIPLNKPNENKIEKKSIVNKIYNYTEKKIGKYPFDKMVISKKNQSRRPIYGINNLPNIISPFSESFLFEFNFLKEFLHTYFEESISFHKRKDYWIIDGMVIYLLMDYVDTYYPNLKLIGKYSDLKILKNRNYANYSFNEQFRLFENIISSRNIGQSINTTLDSLTRINLKIINPYKSGIGMKMLSNILSKETIETSIRDYFKKNSLNRSNNSSFKSILENNGFAKSNWFFEEYLQKKLFKDFSIKNINSTANNTFFKITKHYDSKIPVQLSLIKNNKVIKNKWLDIKKRDTIVSFNSNFYDFVELNKDKYVTETKYKNNFASFEKYNKPLKFVLFTDFENIYNKQINYIPLLGYNLYDGLMPGIDLTNITLIKKPFNYKIKSFYSSKQKKLLGSMNLKFTDYNENKKLFSTQYFLSGSTFHYKDNLSYTSFFPSVTFLFRNSDLRSNFRQFLAFKYISIYREENNDQKKYPNYNIFNVKYIISDSYGGKGISLNTDLQINKSFIKTSITGRFRNYYKDNRQYNIRFFLGKFFYNKTDDDYFSFSTYRTRDYMFNYNLLGRSEDSGFYSQQFINTEGALKSRVKPAYSNNWIFSINSGITIWQWVEGYYDFAIIKNKGIKTKTAYDSGIRLNILTDYFELYFPFYSSLGNELKVPSYIDRIRFKVTFDPNTLTGLFTRRWF